MFVCQEEKNLKYGKTAGDVRTLLAFTIPLILSGLFQQVFNWVDAFIVGNVEGELALAGIGATTSIYNLFVTVITGFTSGLSVLTAQQFGMGKEKEIGAILPFPLRVRCLQAGFCCFWTLRPISLTVRRDI